jgi:uncharacterized protein (DUF849 family)
MANKVIISCAVTGSIHTPTMSPYLPFTPEDIARQAIGAAEAGAAILHFHARDPNTGEPNGDPATYMQFLPAIKAATDAVINITTGGGLTMNLDQRLAPALRFKPELASFNMGSINFSIHRSARRHSEWKHEWEEPYLKKTEGNIFRNTFVDMKRVLKELGEGCGTRFEYECYDLGHLYNLAYLLDEGLVEPPFFLQSVFGILGGMGTEVELLSYVRAHLPVVGDRTGTSPDADWDIGRASGRTCSCGPGRQSVAAQGGTGKIQRGPGEKDSRNPGGTFLRDCDTR